MAKSTRKTDAAEVFTEDRIRRVKPPITGRVYIYDSNQPALALCVTAAGCRTFYFRKRLNGKYISTPIARTNEISVGQAREAVQRMLGDALVRGVDPIQEKREQAAKTARESVTIGDLWAYYLENHAKAHKRTWKADQQRYDRQLTRWSRKHLADITPADVEQWHKRIGSKTPTEANRALEMLACMFTFAEKVGFDGKNPAKGIKRFAEKQRERFLHRDELPRFFAAVGELRIRSAAAADILELCIWTAARSGNIKSMKWENISFERATWTIPAEIFKTGKAVTIALTDQAMAILNRRKQTAKTEFVFPSRSETGHMIDVRKHWTRLLKTANLEGVRMHDLRRTAGSWMAAGGTSLHIIGKALGHSGTAATSIYARLDLDPVRLAISNAADAIQAASIAK